MQCEACGKPATAYVCEITDGKQSGRHLCKACAEAIVPPITKAEIREMLDRRNEQIRRGHFADPPRQPSELLLSKVYPTPVRRSCHVCGAPAAFRRPDDAVPDAAAEWFCIDHTPLVWSPPDETSHGAWQVAQRAALVARFMRAMGRAPSTPDELSEFKQNLGSGECGCPPKLSRETLKWIERLETFAGTIEAELGES